MSFVHLRVHSNFSFLAGTMSVEDMVRAAAAAGMPSIALTDTDGLYAVVPFQRACAEAGVRPVYGAVLTGPWDGDESSCGAAGGLSRGRARVTLLARNGEGYGELCRLVTARHLDEGFCLAHSLDGISDDLYVLADDGRILRRLRGRENLLVALPVAPGRGRDGLRWRLRRLASELGLRTAAAGEVFFADRSDYPVHRLLTAIRTRSTIGTLRGGEAAPPEAFFRGARAVGKVFDDDPGSVRRAGEIAGDCRVELDLASRKLPAFRTPPGEGSPSLLRRLALEGLRGRAGEPDGPGGGRMWRASLDKLEGELRVIESKGLSDYFLICWDIVRFARERGMRSVGRGSAGNSLVSYALGITHVNPLRHNLFFERFLNPGRERLPDFDIDFATDDREEVLRYIFRRYGRDRAAMIGTYSTMRARAALRETAKALGIPEGEVAPFIKRVPHFASTQRLREACAASPAAESIPFDREPLRTVLSLAERIGGFPRHMATHPCGLVISPVPITDLVPLQRGDKGYRITQWSMHEIEKAGLVKIDIIGQKGLAVIQEAAGMAGENLARPIDAARIDYLGDAETKRLLREGRTEGCFYIESPVMIQLMRQARCDDFEVLTALSSIIRPGVSSYGGKRSYLRRHLGLEPVSSMHPSVDEVLCDTYGCLIYQEQVIRIAVAVAGMSYAEADGLRRCMSFKNDDDETMSCYGESFVGRARGRGIPEGTAREVFRQMASFAGYAFCKAHSASFALESFESAYWKAHFPAEFMAAVLSNGGGYYSQEEYLEEARRMGLEILPPCINCSRIRNHGRGLRLRIGLMQVKGLTSETAGGIVESRPFRSLGEFLEKVPARSDEVEALIRSGAMASLGRTRPELLWEHRVLSGGDGAAGRGALEDGAAGRGRSGGGTDTPPGGGEHGSEVAGAAGRGRAVSLVERIPPIDDYTLSRRVELERETLDIAVSAHPLAMFERELSALRRTGRIIRSVDIGRHVGHEVQLVGWRVTVKPTRSADRGESMAFVTFSDSYGRFEAVLFPDAYRRAAGELVRGRGPFLISGRVESELGVESLVGQDVRFIVECT